MSTNPPREFVFGAATLSDPDPGMTAQQVKDAYAAAYPELTTASISGPEAKDGKQIYTFKRSVGTKG